MVKLETDEFRKLSSVIEGNYIVIQQINYRTCSAAFLEANYGYVFKKSVSKCLTLARNNRTIKHL